MVLIIPGWPENVYSDPEHSFHPDLHPKVLRNPGNRKIKEEQGNHLCLIRLAGLILPDQ
jgi:hypothetical protein